MAGPRKYKVLHCVYIATVFLFIQRIDTRYNNASVARQGVEREKNEVTNDREIGLCSPGRMARR